MSAVGVEIRDTIVGVGLAVGLVVTVGVVEGVNDGLTVADGVG